MWLSIIILSVLLILYVPLVSWVASRIDVKQPSIRRIVFLFGSLLILQLVHVYLIPGQSLFLLLLIALPATVIATIGLFEFRWQLKLPHLLVPVTSTCIMLLSALLLIEITNRQEEPEDLLVVKMETDQVLNRIARAAEKICLCETDTECIKQATSNFGAVTKSFVHIQWTAADIHRLQRYTQRGFNCSYQPGKYDSLLAVVKVIEKGNSGQINSETQTERGDGNPAKKLHALSINNHIDTASISEENNTDTTYTHSISLSEAVQFIGKSARLQRKNGVVLKGRIVAVNADQIMFEQQKFGGKISHSVRLSEIITLESLF